MQKTIVWVTLALVIIALTLIALGHPGQTAERGTIRLVPFEEYPRVIRCIIRGCPAVKSSWYYLIVNGAGNIVVFMPLGMILYVALKHQASAPGHPILFATLVGALISLIFEVVQLWIPGRVTALDDIILNAAGTLLGSFTIKWGEAIFSPNK
jgi:glycopeptide antibiotics resistance protein